MAVLLTVLVLLSLLGSGLMAGLFFAFSVAIMPALGTEPGPAAMAAMQRINVVIVRPLFLAVFVGTALVALAAAVVSLLDAGTVTAWTVAGTALYVVASIGLTSGYHVPRNNRLVAGDPTTARGTGALGDLPARVDPLEPRPRGRVPARDGGVRHRPAGVLSTTLRPCRRRRRRTDRPTRSPRRPVATRRPVSRRTRRWCASTSACSPSGPSVR